MRSINRECRIVAAGIVLAAVWIEAQVPCGPGASCLVAIARESQPLRGGSAGVIVTVSGNGSAYAYSGAPSAFWVG